jgi:ABC-type branched-subunit amino acid transport system substrate-binding protein
MRPRSILQAALCVLALAAGAVACSSPPRAAGHGPAPGTTQAGGQAATSPAAVPVPPGPATGPPLVVGTLVPLSGPGLADPAMLAGVKAAARSLNLAGGVDGHPVQVVECDDGNDMGRAEACARELVADQVVAVAGGASLFGDRIAAVLGQAGVPEVGMVPLSAAEYNAPNVFLLDSGNAGAYLAALALAYQAGLRSFFVALSDAARGQDLLTVLKLAARRVGPGISLRSGSPGPASPGLGPLVQAAAAAQAQALVPVVAPGQLASLVAAAGQAQHGFRYVAAWRQLSPSDLDSLGRSGGPLDGALLGSGLPPPSAARSIPALRAFERDMRAERAAGDQAAAPSQLDYGAELGWLAVQALAKVVAGRPGPLTAAGVTQDLEAAQAVPLGLVPAWTPSRAGPPGFARVSNPDVYLLSVRDGQAVLEGHRTFNFYDALGGL